MSAVVRILLGAALVVPASAGTTAARPPIRLTASPAHVVVRGSGDATVRVSNSGRRSAVVDVRRAGFALDLRGRPKVVSVRRGSALSWITVRPQHLTIGSGRTASVTLTARPPRRAEPGDHVALVLLATRPRLEAGVAVKMRLGIVVGVRVAGRLRHQLLLRSLRVRRHGRLRTLELLVTNRGNVTEEFARDRVTVALKRAGRPLVKLRAEPRELLPGTSGVFVFRYRGRARGPVSALATVVPAAGSSSVSRAYRIRL